MLIRNRVDFTANGDRSLRVGSSACTEREGVGNWLEKGKNGMDEKPFDSVAQRERSEVDAGFRPIAIPEVVAAQLMLTNGLTENAQRERRSREKRLPLIDIQTD